MSGATPGPPETPMTRVTPVTLMTPTTRTESLSVTARARLGRRAQLLAAATVAYNFVEAVVAVSAGRAAGSSALIGFEGQQCPLLGVAMLATSTESLPNSVEVGTSS